MVVRSPCQENYPADAHPSAHKSVLESANPAWTRSVHLDAPGQRHGQQPVSGTADPGVVKQDKSSRGSVDTTKTRSGPQRVRMSCGERPMGAPKGKQSDTEALCQPHPPVIRCAVWPCARGLMDKAMGPPKKTSQVTSGGKATHHAVCSPDCTYVLAQCCTHVLTGHTKHTLTTTRVATQKRCVKVRDRRASVFPSCPLHFTMGLS